MLWSAAPPTQNCQRGHFVWEGQRSTKSSVNIFFNHVCDFQDTLLKTAAKIVFHIRGGIVPQPPPATKRRQGRVFHNPFSLEYDHPTVFHIPRAPAQKAKEFEGFQPSMFHGRGVEHCLRPVKMPAKMWNAPPPMQKRQRSMEHSPPARVERCFSLVF